MTSGVLALAIGFSVGCGTSSGDSNEPGATAGDGDSGDGDTGSGGRDQIEDGNQDGSETQTPSNVNVFVDQIRFSEGGCLPRELPVDDEGRLTCRVIEASTSALDCASAGHEEIPQGALAAVLAELETTGRCGGTSGTPCSDWNVCGVLQLEGAEDEKCQTDASDPSGFDSAGYCYVNDASSAVIADCPATDKRTLRAVGEAIPQEGSVSFLACEAVVQSPNTTPPGGAAAEVGEPCIPGDSALPGFSGFSQLEVNLTTGHEACSSGICLTNHFQGRPLCPYGQSEQELEAEGSERCRTSNDELVEVAVEPQLVNRRADDHVVCSCRCDGPDPGADYCDCPTGTVCEPLVADLGLGGNDLAGSYCIPEGTAFNPSAPETQSCDRGLDNNCQ